MNVITDLQNWYASNCDGDWEHQYGVVIDTLDNPGWSFKVDLKGTELEGRSFTSINVEVADNDWFTCFVSDGTFQGAGDSGKLETLIKAFLDWVNSK